jgi:hypothetical protein
LAFFVVIRQRPVFAAIVDSSPLDQLAKGIIGTSALAAFLLFRLFRSKRAASRTPRRARWRGPGRVLLFPGSTSHSRTFPQKHSFSYSYLTVGSPVGFEGNVGGLVSVGVQDKPGKPGLLSWLLHALPVPKAWFTVDAGDYLQRGKSELGLRGKLDEYLQTKVSCSLYDQWSPNSDFVRGTTRQPTPTPIWSLLPVSSATILTPSHSGTCMMPTRT